MELVVGLCVAKNFVLILGLYKYNAAVSATHIM
jgi:hypothetical protein